MLLKINRYFFSPTINALFTPLTDEFSYIFEAHSDLTGYSRSQAQNFFPMLSFDSIHSLTHRDPLVAVWSSQPVSTSSTVVAAEIPITLACAVEKPQRPPLSVVTPRIRVLRPMAAVVCGDGNALAPSRAGATLVPGSPCRRRAALAAPQPLGGDALTGELGHCKGGAQGHHQENRSPHATKVRREGWREVGKSILGTWGELDGRIKLRNAERVDAFLHVENCFASIHPSLSKPLIVFRGRVLSQHTFGKMKPKNSIHWRYTLQLSSKLNGLVFSCSSQLS